MLDSDLLLQIVHPHQMSNISLTTPGRLTNAHRGKVEIRIKMGLYGMKLAAQKRLEIRPCIIRNPMKVGFSCHPGRASECGERPLQPYSGLSCSRNGILGIPHRNIYDRLPLRCILSFLSFLFTRRQLLASAANFSLSFIAQLAWLLTFFTVVYIVIFFPLFSFHSA